MRTFSNSGIYVKIFLNENKKKNLQLSYTLSTSFASYGNPNLSHGVATGAGLEKAPVRED